AVMLKYAAAVVLVFGLAFYISVQDERAAQQPAQEAAQPTKIAPPAKSDENHPQQNIRNPERNAPRWYRFFRWGDGTTIWVIVLTLMAIAEQTSETRRSVLVNVRPRLLIRGIEVLPSNPETDDASSISPPRHIKIGVANAGGSDA